jgi:non-heme chloroperoxidase
MSWLTLVFQSPEFDILNLTAANMKTIDLNDYTFNYVETGVGAPVIFVHGSINDFRIWDNQIDSFSKHFNTISYSRRYHYPNQQQPDGYYTVQQHSNDLFAFIKELRLDTVNLVGSSYGAYICLDLAIKNPEEVKTLVLGEPPILPLLVDNPTNIISLLALLFKDFTTGKSLLSFAIKAIEPAKKQLSKDNMEDGVRLFANGVLGEGGYENLPPEAQETLNDNALALKMELSQDLPQFAETEAAEMNVPTLLVYGKESPKFFHAISDKLYKLLNNCERITIPDTSHDVHLGKPSLYNQKVMEFILNHN